MARQALTIGGAIVGSFFGQPQLGFVIGSLVGNYVDPQVVKTPRIKDLPSQTADEGGYRQVVYGTCWINETNIIDFSDVRRVTQRERQGKGGGPVVESERLYRTYAIGLGEPLEAIRVIRRDGKIVYDVRPGSTILADSAAFAERFRFYTGAEDQLPDPDLEAIHGVGNTPYYRGTAYIVFPNDDLTDTQGRIPTYEVEGVTSASFLPTGASVVTDSGFYTGTATSLSVGTGSPWTVAFALDGTGALSFDGTFAAAGRGDYPYLMVSRLVDGAWTACSVDVAPSAGVAGCSFSPSGSHLAVVFSGTIFVYSRSGSSFTKVAEVTGLPTNGKVAFSPNGQKLGVIFYTTSPPTRGCRVYQFNPSTGALSDPVDLGTGLSVNPVYLAWNPADSRYLAIANGSGIQILDTENSPMTIAASVGGVGTGRGGRGLAWDRSGAYLFAASHALISGAYIEVFEFESGNPGFESLTYLTPPVAQPPSCEGLALFPGGNHLIVATGTTQPYLYAISAGLPPVLTQASVQPPASPVAIKDVYTTLAGSVVEGDAVPLSFVLEDICDRCGLLASEVDFSALDGVSVNGVTLGGGYTGADAIMLFMPAYHFDLVQPDKVLTAVKRGGASKGSVTADDFVESPDENILRGQDIEVPRVLMLKYLNPGQNYAAPAAVVSRTSPDVRVSGEATADLPISFDETGALRVADRMLKVMWEDLNGEITFSLPSGPWAWLTPTDILTLSLRGGLYRIRVEKVEESAGVLKVTARRDRQSAYTSNLTAPSLPAPTPPPPAQPGATTFVVMNLPALIDEDDRLGVYIAMTGAEDSAWAGAQVAYRQQGATDWIVLGNFTTRAVMGELLAPLPYASPFYTDTTNPLSVSLEYAADQLETLTYTEFLSERNPAAIVKPDYTAEIVQFRYAEDDGDSDWTLTTLQRGRLNTEPVTHSAGARFVMLDGAIFLPLPSSLIGKTLEFRVTSLGTSPETAPTQTLVWNPVYSQYEFPVHDLTLTRGGGTISGAWSPRHRFGTDVNPVASANFTGYRVTLTDGTTTNSFTVTDPNFSTSDSPYVGTITVSVAALNRFTGAGPSVSESI